MKELQQITIAAQLITLILLSNHLCEIKRVSAEPTATRTTTTNCSPSRSLSLSRCCCCCCCLSRRKKEAPFQGNPRQLNFLSKNKPTIAYNNLTLFASYFPAAEKRVLLLLNSQLSLFIPASSSLQEKVSLFVSCAAALPSASASTASAGGCEREAAVQSTERSSLCLFGCNCTKKSLELSASKQLSETNRR